jgi:hypothetical protein
MFSPKPWTILTPSDMQLDVLRAELLHYSLDAPAQKHTTPRSPSPRPMQLGPLMRMPLDVCYTVR